MICCYYIDMLLLQDGTTALHCACIEGHTEVVKHLINNNADISATDIVSEYAVAMFFVYFLDLYVNQIINSYKEN